ncbi:hypothetical protein Ciccas_009320 [Cichlidogyrus casuarinus]|uniref:Uncharacterized protein n=1 Tax=Cichlidogyrus casuarinus TaxID=1844966 RepID=A0ABD2PXL5_9PLAT
MQQEIEDWFRFSIGLIPTREYKKSQSLMLNLFFSIQTDEEIDNFFSDLRDEAKHVLTAYSQKCREFSSNRISSTELVRTFASVLSHRLISYRKKLEKISELCSTLGKSNTDARRLSRTCLEDCLQDQISQLESFSNLDDSKTRVLLSLGILKALLCARDNCNEVIEFFDLLIHRISKGNKIKELGDGPSKSKPIWALFLLHSTRSFHDFIKVISQKSKREIFLEFEHAFHSFEHGIRAPETDRFMDLIFWFGALITHKDTSKMEKIFFTKELNLLFKEAQVLEPDSPVRKRSDNILKVMNQFYAEESTSVEPQIIATFSARHFFSSHELEQVHRETVEKYRLLVLKPLLLVLEHLKAPKRKSQTQSHVSIVLVQEQEAKPLPIKQLSDIEEFIFLASSTVHISMGGRAELYKGNTKGDSQSEIISKLQVSSEHANLMDKSFLHWKDVVHSFLLLLRYELVPKLNEFLTDVLQFLLEKEPKKDTDWFHELAENFETKSLETPQLVVALLTEATIRMRRLFLDEEINRCNYNTLFVAQVYMLRVALAIVRRLRSKNTAGAEFEIGEQYFGAVPYALMMTVTIETRVLAILTEVTMKGVMRLELLAKRLSEQSQHKGFLTNILALDWLESLQKHMMRNFVVLPATEMVVEVSDAVKELQHIFKIIEQMDDDTRDVVSQTLCEWLAKYDQLDEFLQQGKFSDVAKDLITLAQTFNNDHKMNLEDCAYNCDKFLITEKILQQLMLLLFLLLWLWKTAPGHNEDNCQLVCHSFVTAMKSYIQL